MTLAWFDVAGRSRSSGRGWATSRRASCARARARARPWWLGGVLRHEPPDRARLATVALEPGDTVVLATDGVAADFSESIDPAAAAQHVADHVLARHGKGTDDALVAVVRVLGE